MPQADDPEESLEKGIDEDLLAKSLPSFVLNRRGGFAVRNDDETGGSFKKPRHLKLKFSLLSREMKRKADEDKKRREYEARVRKEAQNLKEKMSSIDGLINGLERENEDFENEVGEIEASLES